MVDLPQGIQGVLNNLQKKFLQSNTINAIITLWQIGMLEYGISYNDKRGRLSYHIAISDCGFWNLGFKHYFFVGRLVGQPSPVDK